MSKKNTNKSPNRLCSNALWAFLPSVWSRLKRFAQFPGDARGWSAMPRGAFVILFLLPQFSYTQDTAKVIIEAQSGSQADPRIYRVNAESTATVHDTNTTQSVRLSLETIQGTEGPFVIELIGNAEVTKVEGEQILSWAVRKNGEKRFLEISAKPDAAILKPLLTLRSPTYTLPVEFGLSHFGIGKAASFSNTIEINYDKGVAGKVVATNQFLPLSTEAKNQFHT